MMATATTRTFKSGNREAVRLPRDLAYGVGTEVVMERSGDVLTIYPKTGGLDRPQDWKSRVEALADTLDSMPKPSSIQKRDEIEIPERPGL